MVVLADVIKLKLCREIMTLGSTLASKQGGIILKEVLMCVMVFCTTQLLLLCCLMPSDVG